CRCRSSRRCHFSCAGIAAREARLQIFLRSARWWRIVLTRVGSILLNRKAAGKVLRRVLIIFSLSQRKLSGRVEPDEGGLISGALIARLRFGGIALIALPTLRAHKHDQGTGLRCHPMASERGTARLYVEIADCPAAWEAGELPKV